MKYTINDIQYHIGLEPGTVGRYVLLPGDPKRCSKIAAYLDDARLVGDSREFVTYTGTLDGVPVSVTSTGIGGASAVIAMEELTRIGADTFLRVGTCGGMAQDVMGGDLVIATGAVRAEGTSREYAPIEYPAVAHHEVVFTLWQASEMLFSERPELVGSLAENESSLHKAQQAAGMKPAKDGGIAAYIPRTHIGVVHCKDSFYGQHEPDRMPVSDYLNYNWEAWLGMGCLASEMESAALFITAQHLRVRAGAVLQVFANQEREKAGLDNPLRKDTDPAIRTAIEAIRILIQRDQAKLK